MLERGSGKIMNVASTAGFQPGPLMAVYYATKAYVISFSEALANELAGKGVTVTCLCPGPTETDFASRAGNDKSRLFKQLRPMDAKTRRAQGLSRPDGGQDAGDSWIKELVAGRVVADQSAKAGDRGIAAG